MAAASALQMLHRARLDGISGLHRTERERDGLPVLRGEVHLLATGQTAVVTTAAPTGVTAALTRADHIVLAVPTVVTLATAAAAVVVMHRLLKRGTDDARQCGMVVGRRERRLVDALATTGQAVDYVGVTLLAVATRGEAGGSGGADNGSGSSRQGLCAD